MKMFRIILCFFIIFSLVSCGKNELMDLSGFIDNYNDISQSDLHLTDFIIQKNTDTVYTAVVDEVLLSLREGNEGKIESCTVAITKSDKKAPSQEEVARFSDILTYTLSAFCPYENGEIQDVINSFELATAETFSKEGELTLKKDNFHFVYYSTQIISQLTIQNTYIEEIESTQKPVSKPYFGKDFVVENEE